MSQASSYVISHVSRKDAFVNWCELQPPFLPSGGYPTHKSGYHFTPLSCWLLIVVTHNKKNKYIQVWFTVLLFKEVEQIRYLTKHFHNNHQGSDWTERKSSVQFKSSLFWWTLNWTQFTFLLKELELNLVHLLSELEQKWTEKFSSFFYCKPKVFWCIFHQKMLLTLQFFYELKKLNFFQTKNHNFQKIVL